jgi:hypothetical protein
MNGRIYAEIVPVCPRIIPGINVAAASRIQTETKLTKTALLLIKSSRSSESGSLELCFFLRKICVNTMRATNETNIRMPYNSEGQVLKMNIKVNGYVMTVAQNNIITKFNIAVFCVLFMSFLL